jgi:glycosyltransferase involved in cell wall biosynthesis
MIGEGYSRPSCQQQVDAAGLSEAITFTGPLNPSQVQAHLEASQAILLMSDFEGLPVALLEAMAFGMVPVARDIPSGIPELVIHERTGIIVSDDPDEAAQALLRLAGDRALWLRCSAAARALICDRYSQETSYGKWRLLLEELVQRHAASSSSPYPMDPTRIITSRYLDPLLLVNYQKKSVYRTRIQHFLRTAVAQAKHRIKRLLTRTP